MKKIRILMGMPITLEVVDSVADKVFKEVFAYFKYIDQKFSTYKRNSEITKINDGRLKINEASQDMKKIFALAERTKEETNGYFDIQHKGKIDLSGIVKGWAILQAFKIFKKKGFKNFYIDAGGDIQVSGKNGQGQKWNIGIKNPFKQDEIIKVVRLSDQGIATSGNYIRGSHIYNPKNRNDRLGDVVSITVIGPNVFKADRFATAAFAMGKKGINFIESQKDLEGYMIEKQGIATMTSGFERYTLKS